MFKDPRKTWLLALVVGWGFDLLFWDKTVGVSFPLYIGFVLGAGFWLARENSAKVHKKTLWLVLAIVLVALLPFFRQEPFTAFTGGFLTVVMLMILAHTFMGGRWIEYSISDYLVSWTFLTGDVLVQGGKVFQAAQQWKKHVELDEEEIPSKKNSSSIMPVVRGIIIAVPILLVFASLLAAADPIFESRLSEFWELFDIENLGEYLFRGFLILIIGYGLVGAWYHALFKSQDISLIGIDRPGLGRFLGFVETFVVLGSVNLLFLSFVVIQFRYFFGGDANIALNGYTYSEYARQGFGELVSVAFFSLLLYMGISSATKRETSRQRKIFMILGSLLALNVGVMLVSAFQRLLLYEDAFGFTRLRMYSHVFMVWLGGLLVFLVILEALNRHRLFIFAAVFVMLGFVMTLGILNVDGFVARQNIRRALRNRELDLYYLVTLSDDAVPVFAEEYENPGLPDDLHQELGALIACHHAKNIDNEKSIFSFHYSDFKANRVFSRYASVIESYAVMKDEGGLWTVNVLGERRSCGYDLWRY